MAYFSQTGREITVHQPPKYCMGISKILAPNAAFHTQFMKLS